MSEIAITYEKAIEVINRYNLAIEELKKKEADLNAQYKSGQKDKASYNSMLAQNTKQLKQYAASIGELEKQIIQNARVHKSQETAMKGLGAEMENVKIKYEALSEAQKNSDAGAKTVEDMLNATQKYNEAKAAFDESTQQFGNVEILDTGKNAETLAGQLKLVKEEMAQMKYSGQEGAQGYEILQEQALAMQTAINEVDSDLKEMKKTGLDISALNDAVSLVTESYGHMKDGLNACGIECKTLDTVMAGVQKTMSMLNTTVKVANALEGTFTIVKTGLAIAQTLLNKAMSANPIGAIISVVMLAIGAFTSLYSIFKKLTSSSEANREALQDNGKALQEKIAKEEEHLKHLKARGESEQKITNESIKSYHNLAAETNKHFDEVAKEYKEDEKAYQEALDMKNAMQKKYKESLDQGYQSILRLNAQANQNDLKDSMSETAYAVHEANKAFDEQMETLQLLNNTGKITAEEFAQYSESLEKIKEKAISTAEGKAEEENQKKAAEAHQKRLADAEAAAAKAKAIKEAEIAAIREGEDALLALIQDGAEKQRMQTNLSYDRAIEDLQKKLDTDTNLSETAKEELNKKMLMLEEKRKQELDKISDQEIAKEIEKETKRLQEKLKRVEKQSQDEFALKMQLMEQQKQAELQAIGDTEQQKKDILNKYAAMSEGVTDDDKLQSLRDAMEAELQIAEEGAMRKKEIEENYAYDSEQFRTEFQKELKEKKAEELAAEFQQKFEEDEEKAMLELETELERRRIHLETLQQMEGESIEAFNARKLEAEVDYQTANTLQKEQEIKSAEAVEANKKKVTDGLVNMIDQMAEKNKAFAIASKMIALGNIAVSTGEAIGKGVAQAQSVPFPFNIAAIATTVATVVANVASAISTVKSAKFADGGLVTGPGSGTSDSIPAMLSNGESVMTARATQMFSPVLSAFNTLGGGVPISAAGSSNTVMGEEMLARAVAKGVMMMPQPVVSVQEINTVSNGVKVIQDLATISL